MAVLTSRSVERDLLTAHTKGAVIADCQMLIGDDGHAILAAFDREGVMRRVSLYDASQITLSSLRQLALWDEIPEALQAALCLDVSAHMLAQIREAAGVEEASA